MLKRREASKMDGNAYTCAGVAHVTNCYSGSGGVQKVQVRRQMAGSRALEPEG